MRLSSRNYLSVDECDLIQPHLHTAYEFTTKPPQILHTQLECRHGHTHTHQHPLTM